MDLHPKAVTSKIPTLGIGKGWLGPEAYGCIGTGTRPCISHYPFGWYVGAESDVRDMIAYHCRQSARGQKLEKTFKTGDRITRFYQTRSSAIGYFRVLLSERYRMNDSLRGGHQTAIKQSKSKDPSTAIAGLLAAAEY